MQKYIKRLFAIFVLLVLAKSALSLAIPAPSIWSDEYTYIKLAQSLYSEHAFLIHGKPILTFTPLYPLVISTAHAFSDMHTVYAFMKVINAIISSLIIFPAFFLAREILNEKRALLSAVMVSVVPATFSFSAYIMAENLFYPLFLFAMFFLYRACANPSLKYCVVAGIATGLTILTKPLGVLLFAPALAGMAFGAVNQRKFSQNFLGQENHTAIFSGTKDYFGQAKQFTAFAVSTAVVLLPWLLSKLAQGHQINSFFGSYSTILTAPVRHHGTYLFSFLNWLALYAGFIILASGIVFAILAVIAFKADDFKSRLLMVLSVSAIAAFILFDANYSAGGPVLYSSPFSWFTERPIGRYVDTVLPFVFILGFKGLEILKKEEHKAFLAKVCIGFSALMAFSAQLSIAPLFPSNNMSLSYIGIFKYALERVLFGKVSTETIFNFVSFAVIAVVLALVPLIFYAAHTVKQVSQKKVFLFFFLFFVLLSLANYAIIYTAAQKWQANEQMQLGGWLSEFDKEKNDVWFDARDSGKISVLGNATHQFAQDGHFVAMAGFWLKNKIAIGNVSDVPQNAYIVSRQQLNKAFIKNFGGIYLYKS